MDTFREILGSSSTRSKQASSSQKPKSKSQLAASPPPPPPPSGPPSLASSRRTKRKTAGISSTKPTMSEQPSEPGSTGPLDQPVEAVNLSAQSLLSELPLYGQHPFNLEDSHPNELPAERELPEEILNISPTPIDDQSAILIGVSGITSSGKTTLAHLLRLIIPPTTTVFLLHQEDFLVPKHLLVPSRNGELDADGANAINFASLKRMLKYAKREGKLPSTFHTMQAEEDEHMRAVSLVSQVELDDLKAFVIRSELFQAGRPIGIVDGPLLYYDPTIRSLFDVKIFLRASRDIARQRRFENPKYVDSESGDNFWRTRDYFDRIIWPDYSEEHGPLFENGDVQSRPIVGLCEELGIVIQPELDLSVPETLKWATESIIKDISNQKFQETPNSGLRSQSDHGWLEKIRQTLFDLM
ncbi:ribosylnicotinamide kinase [Sticta canariensis]|nr:ribosylnicotinamide kinase [Sticta canariensis]